MLKATSLRLSDGDRQLLERLRREFGLRSWGEVVRYLLRREHQRRGEGND